MRAVDCNYYIEEKTAPRCGANPPPDEERLWMFQTCKLVGMPEGAYCGDKVEENNV